MYAAGDPYWWRPCFGAGRLAFSFIMRYEIVCVSARATRRDLRMSILTILRYMFPAAAALYQLYYSPTVYDLLGSVAMSP